MGGSPFVGSASRVGDPGPDTPTAGSLVRITGATVTDPGQGGIIGVIDAPFNVPITPRTGYLIKWMPSISAMVGVDPAFPEDQYNPVFSVEMGTNGLANVAGGYWGLLVGSRGQLFNGATFDQQRGGGDNADDVAAVTLGAILALARNTAFDGTNWDRVRAASAAVLSGFTAQGAMLVNPPGNWSITHTPAAATQATISRAAGGAGVRHVCTAIDAVLIIPPGVNQPVITINLRDGATGAGTILWSRSVGIGAALAAGGQQEVSLSGLEIVGSANTAMTLEFSAAGAATTVQSVSLTGHDAN